jgi:hypothetical protein
MGANVFSRLQTQRDVARNVRAGRALHVRLRPTMTDTPRKAPIPKLIVRLHRKTVLPFGPLRCATSAGA